jgi:2-keto-4-pentenoate hydratase/2-oxohepta-3-ene-1,7-dioic acid hydratase in catechol pathway
LVSYGEQARLGAIVGEQVIDLAGASSNAPWSGSMLKLLEAGPEALAAAKQVVATAAEEHRRPLSDVKLLAPLPRPSSLRDAMTFERHVLQVTRAAGLGPLAPVDRVLERLVGARRSLAGRLNAEFYRQPPYYRSNDRSVVGPDAEVRIPRGCERFDYELEWGVVIGREGRDISAAEAGAYIAGYTIFNDFSARDIQLAEMRSRLGPAKGKNFDTGNAIGPCLVTPDELPDPYELTMTARVNGVEWSRARSGEAYWRFEQLIEHISRDETLYPGDFIGSGTCSGADGMGCGLEQGRFLSPGDVVELEVERIGVLRNRVTK